MQSFLTNLARHTNERPHAAAAVMDGVALSYAELDAASDLLATRIFEVRHGDNDIVGFYGDVGLARIVAYTGAIKAGAGYAQLDPALPRPALRDVIGHADIAHVVAASGDIAAAADLTGMTPIPVVFGDAIATPPEKFPDLPEIPGALVAIRYTSGSTGKPKAIAVARSHWESRAAKRRPSARVGPGDRVAIFNQFWMEEEFVALASGAQLECFDFRRDGPQRMASWLAEREITRLPTYAAMYRAMMLASRAAYPKMRTVELVGEILIRADLEAFHERFGPAAVLINRFSSIEGGTIAEYTHRSGDPIEHDTLPIGQIVAEADVHILTEAGAEAADGEPGELVIIADYTPDGYYKDPARSAAFFEPAFDGSGRSQLRSGFRVFRDFRGDLHPIGRIDEEIKIRGYNVRPSEVEQMLLDHPGVAVAAVAPFVGPKGIRRLACHFVPATEPAPTQADLRAFLAGKAANYMIPGIFLAHDALPRTDNGKIRRQSLPDPLARLAGIERAEPASALEATLVAIWRDVLGHGDFDTRDDFFDVGGDSLQAMAALVAIEAASGVRLPLESLVLSGATVESLAERIAAGERPEPSAPVVLKRGDGERPIFAAPVRGGHHSDYLELLHAMNPRQSVYGLPPKGMNGRAPPDRSIDAMAEHAAQMIRRHKPNGPYLLLGYSYGAMVAFETARRLSEPGGRVDGLVLVEPIAPWSEAFRDARKVLRTLKVGAIADSMRRGVEILPGIVGFGSIDGDIDAAHRAALRAYRPQPASIGRALIVAAEDNRWRLRSTREWRRLLGPDAEAIPHAGDHLTVLKTPNVQSLAQKIDRWLATAATPR